MISRDFFFSVQAVAPSAISTALQRMADARG